VHVRNFFYLWHWNMNNIFLYNWFFVSNWQKVQLNTDLLKTMAQVFIHKLSGWLKQNEIKGLIKKRE
jgi:hypothetical protein